MCVHCVYERERERERERMRERMTALFCTLPAVPPEITFLTQDQTIEAGMSATFICLARGVPSPTLSWLQEDTLLTVQGRFRPSGTAFMISNVEEGDTSNYTCRANNTAGVDEETRRLIVFGESLCNIPSVPNQWSTVVN